MSCLPERRCSKELFFNFETVCTYRTFYFSESKKFSQLECKKEQRDLDLLFKYVSILPIKLKKKMFKLSF